MSLLFFPMSSTTLIHDINNKFTSEPILCPRELSVIDPPGTSLYLRSWTPMGDVIVSKVADHYGHPQGNRCIYEDDLCVPGLLYVVSEGGTIWAFEVMDTLELAPTPLEEVEYRL